MEKDENRLRSKTLFNEPFQQSYSKENKEMTFFFSWISLYCVHVFLIILNIDKNVLLTVL